MMSCKAVHRKFLGELSTGRRPIDFRHLGSVFGSDWGLKAVGVLKLMESVQLKQLIEANVLKAEGE